MSGITATGQFLPGQLVRCRGRDWVVLAPRAGNLVRLRPVDGSPDATISISPDVEPAALQEATYGLPDAAITGHPETAMLLRDAARLTLRAGAGPFRSLGHVAVSPRPYQFVPLIMALRLDPVRLLIADDVGIGKTIEAALIARELLDRGVARRLAVICPPHLCEQWETELREKFNLDAAVIQPSRMARLERELPRSDVSVFQHYQNLVASIDYVKRNEAFIQNCPDLVIVDEAHAAARPGGASGPVQQQRHELLQRLAADGARHIILVTATPHSGIEDSFRSLLGILRPEFDVAVQSDLEMRPLVPHLVQRRRADLEKWMGSETVFPTRESAEVPYQMTTAYTRLYERVLRYCRESVAAADGGRPQQRVRYWAAIAILRCVLSSPAAAESVLLNQSRREGVDDDIDADAVFPLQILDTSDEEQPPDFVPVVALDAEEGSAVGDRQSIRALLREASGLRGPAADAKLAALITHLTGLLREGCSPIVYCRFIGTANYVAEYLAKSKELQAAASGLHVIAVTGEIGDEQRRERIAELGQHERRILVATDCLSEGINLQHDFDAVLHYDLPWNPNRLEQREGRVDRYGQERPTVKTALLFGTNNDVDLTVLEVLIRKARKIRQRLGIAVPVPVDSEQVIQAVVDNVLLRGPARPQQLSLALSDNQVSTLHREWDEAADRESKSRGFFAQQGIHPDEVSRELEELEPALGDARSVRRFLQAALQKFGGELRPTRKAEVFELHPADLAPQIVAAIGETAFPIRVSFDGLPRERVHGLTRHHPLVDVVATTVLGAALSPEPTTQFARAGAVATIDVTERTAILVLRLRYLLEESGAQQFAEEVVVAGFRDGLAWLDPLQDEALRLLGNVTPVANLSPELRTSHVEWALGQLDNQWFAPIVAERTQALVDSHARLRKTVGAKALNVTPHTPPDVLGCYVLVPGNAGR